MRRVLIDAPAWCVFHCGPAEVSGQLGPVGVPLPGPQAAKEHTYDVLRVARPLRRIGTLPEDEPKQSRERRRSSQVRGPSHRRHFVLHSKVGPGGLQPSPENAMNPSLLPASAALALHSGQESSGDGLELSDDLAAVIAAWPTLPAGVRHAILELVNRQA